MPKILVDIVFWARKALGKGKSQEGRTFHTSPDAAATGDLSKCLCLVASYVIPLIRYKCEIYDYYRYSIYYYHNYYQYYNYRFNNYYHYYIYYHYYYHLCYYLCYCYNLCYYCYQYNKL